MSAAFAAWWDGLGLDPDGRRIRAGAEFPVDLRVRQYPEAVPAS